MSAFVSTTFWLMGKLVLYFFEVCFHFSMPWQSGNDINRLFWETSLPFSVCRSKGIGKTCITSK